MTHQDPVLNFILHTLEAYHVPVQSVQADPGAAAPDVGVYADMVQSQRLNSLIFRFISSLEPGRLYFVHDIFSSIYVLFTPPGTPEITIIGPILYEAVDTERFSALLRTYRIPEHFAPRLLEYFSQIPQIPSLSFLEHLFCQLAQHLYGSGAAPVYIQIADYIEEMPIRLNTLLSRDPQSPAGVDLIEKIHKMELALMSTIVSGNQELSLTLFGSLMELGKAGIPRLKNTHRDHINYLIGLSAFFCKEATLNGIHPACLQEANGQFVQRSEQCTDSSQLNRAFEALICAYCSAVKNHMLNGHSPHIGRILAYIHTDLRMDLSLKALADCLNVNASYLSDLFSREVGTSLTNYVTARRVELAQSLLSFTDLPIKTVAECCGFSNIQYFSKLFRKYTAQSPKRYRQDYYLTEPDHAADNVQS